MKYLRQIGQRKKIKEIRLKVSNFIEQKSKAQELKIGAITNQKTNNRKTGDA